MKISPNDNKNYLAMTLDNGLRVVIVEHEASHKSACSLVVNAGHFDDPTDRPGFAHFVEHLLFNGNNKYPEANNLNQFISQHGGHCNAWTGTEHSCYHFDVHPEYFGPALDRFVHMFIEPLFSPEALKREQEAIHEEYKLKLQDDSRRIQQVHKQTSNPEHPFHKFSVGNKHTLSDLPQRPVIDEVREFWQNHYQAQFMTVAIVTAEPIELVRELVNNCFSGIKNSNKKPTKSKIEVPLYRPEDLNRFVTIRPVKELHKLNITFAMPNMDHMYQTKMLSFVAHIMGDEGTGSLFAALKDKGYINALSAGNGISGANFKDFNLSIELTELGEDNLDEILVMVFGYINFLKQTQPKPCLYSEQQVLNGISFHYQEEIKPSKLANQIALNMQHYPEVDYLSGDYRMDGFDEAHWQEVLTYLHANNVRITLVSQSSPAELSAPWYHTPYSTTVIDQATRQQLDATDGSQWHFKLPENNPYLGGEIKLEAPDFSSLIPINIEDRFGWRTWFKQDISFRVPKGNIYLGLDLPNGINSKRHQAMMRLFCDMFMDDVAQQHYHAEMAGLHYNVYAHNGGITIYTSGLSNKQHELLLTLIDTMLAPQFVLTRFNEIRRQLVKHWNNSEANRPVSRLFSQLNSTLIPNVGNSIELAELLMTIEFEEFNQFIAQLFDAVNAEILIYGNWTSQQAIKINALVAEKFNHSELVAENPRPNIALSHGGVSAIRTAVQHTDKAAVLYIQNVLSEPNAGDTYDKGCFILLSQILAPYAFNFLRTEKQLGYLVGSGYMPICDVPGLAVYVQSHEVSSDDLRRHIYDCVDGFLTELMALPEDEFNAHKQAVIHQYLEKPANLTQKCQQLWISVGNKDYQFNQRMQIVAELQRISLEQLQTWAKVTLDLQTAAGYIITTE